MTPRVHGGHDFAYDEGVSAQSIIETLGLQPHPEGGWYARVWRDDARGRGRGSSIYYLLQAGEHAHWHRIDATEIWQFHAGAPLRLFLAPEGAVRELVLGPELQAEQRPQRIVPPNVWQRAETSGAWTLVGCMVVPAFEFEHFELAPPGWHPRGD